MLDYLKKVLLLAYAIDFRKVLTAEGMHHHQL